MREPPTETGRAAELAAVPSLAHRLSNRCSLGRHLGERVCGSWEVWEVKGLLLLGSGEEASGWRPRMVWTQVGCSQG